MNSMSDKHTLSESIANLIDNIIGKSKATFFCCFLCVISVMECLISLENIKYIHLVIIFAVSLISSKILNFLGVNIFLEYLKKCLHNFLNNWLDSEKKEKINKLNIKIAELEKNKNYIINNQNNMIKKLNEEITSLNVDIAGYALKKEGISEEEFNKHYITREYYNSILKENKKLYDYIKKLTGDIYIPAKFMYDSDVDENNEKLKETLGKIVKLIELDQEKFMSLDNKTIQDKPIKEWFKE